MNEDLELNSINLDENSLDASPFVHNLMYSIYSQAKSQFDAQEINDVYETSDELFNDVPQENLSENDVYLL